MPPNRFESEVESFLEGSHGDRTHIKRADHHTVTPLCGTLLHLDTSDARDDQPDRKHERAPTPDAARPPRHAPDPTHESRVLVVLHPLSPPATSSDNPGDHAHRRSPRKCLVSSLSNPPSHRHHPRLGRRNLLERTPPHHPLPQHLGLTPATRNVL